jgi:hypothetical protein
MRSIQLCLISAEKANLPCPRLWTYKIAETASYPIFYGKNRRQFFRIVKVQIHLILHSKHLLISEIPVVDISPKFHLPITQNGRKRRPDLLRPPFMPNSTAQQTQLLYQHKPIHRAINADRHLLSLSSTQLSPPVTVRATDQSCMELLGGFTKVSSCMLVYSYYIKSDRQNLAF